MKGESMTVKSRLLELLEQHKGELLSGEDIGKELSCTRACARKVIPLKRDQIKDILWQKKVIYYPLREYGCF